jgi:hypothetical protein
MSLSGPPSHLARITAIDLSDDTAAVFAGGVFGFRGLFMHSTLLLLFQAGWTFLMLLGSILGSHDAAVGTTLVVLAAAWMTTQFMLVATYPEWPLNRLLCRRLRQAVAKRRNPVVRADERDVRVVELVPRERWRKLSMENATDLMLMRIDPTGVWMTGDGFEYALPCEAILSAELHSLRPPGCFAMTHIVVLYVRTAQGPLELPLSYRDHSLGSLTSRKRRAAAMQMAERINNMAKGYYYQPPTAPEIEVLAAADTAAASPFVSPTIFAE